MTSPDVLVHHLFDGLRRLDEAEVGCALDQGVDLTARDAQGRGVFQALFECPYLDLMDVTEWHATQARIETRLWREGAQFPSDPDAMGATLASGVAMVLEAVRELGEPHDEGLRRLTGWLTRAPLQGQGAVWGEACVAAWWTQMQEAEEQENEDVLALGVDLVPALLHQGVPLTCFDRVTPDFLAWERLQTVLEVARRTQHAQRAVPAQPRHRRRS
jgi:hypothetical protein